jgi:hypothetical protein
MPETAVIVGASLAVHFFVGPGRSSLGPSSCPYSAECVEGVMCELRRHGVLGSCTSAFYLSTNFAF